MANKVLIKLCYLFFQLINLLIILNIRKLDVINYRLWYYVK